jgi:hypothetical protein
VVDVDVVTVDVVDDDVVSVVVVDVDCVVEVLDVVVGHIWT